MATTERIKVALQAVTATAVVLAMLVGEARSQDIGNAGTRKLCVVTLLGLIHRGKVPELDSPTKRKRMGIHAHTYRPSHDALNCLFSFGQSWIYVVAVGEETYLTRFTIKSFEVLPPTPGTE